MLLPTDYPNHIELTFHTPLRLQQHNSVLGIKRLTPAILLKQLLRRTSALAALYWQHIDTDYPALAEAADKVEGRSELTWQDWHRYSSRQQQEMILGGAIGTWQLYHLPLSYGQLLYIGQWLHIGKETVFGHGRYTIKEC